MKLLAAFVTLFSLSAQAAWTPQGRYLGSCIGYYVKDTSGACQMELYVDSASQVTIPGNAACISPTTFSGVLFDPRETVELRAGGWAAQPKGQTLSLNFTKGGGRWRATGSGRGISDGKWTYRCTFQQQ